MVGVPLLAGLIDVVGVALIPRLDAMVAPATDKANSLSHAYRNSDNPGGASDTLQAIAERERLATRRDAVATRMTREDLSEAQRRAQEWSPE